MVSSQRYNFFLVEFFIMCSMLQCGKVYGRRKSRSRDDNIEDPKKPNLLLERDIFLVSTEPSTIPTSKPSSIPSVWPTRMESSNPSYQPTLFPTGTPTSQPTLIPSVPPSTIPSSTPSYQPTLIPTSQPSMTPTLLPSIDPTPSPSLLSSDIPSLFPSLSPSMDPTQFPSNIPSLPTLTSSPTELFPLGEAPRLDEPRSRSYFNYDPFDVNYGPGQATPKVYHYNETKEETILIHEERNVTTWTLENITDATTKTTSLVNLTKVQTILKATKSTRNITIPKSLEYTYYDGNTWSSVRNSQEHQYWKDFNMNRTLGNRCDSKPWRKQSPIDLCEVHVNSKCREHHQIRNRAGNLNLDDADVELQILPSKLRIKYSRNNSQLDKDVGLIPPHADFPLNWNGYISTVHIDIKIPSEHTICGKRYAGEYQIFFYHPKRKLPVVQSVLIEIHPKNRPHLHFQKVLNEWQAMFDLKHLECNTRQRRLKRDQTRFLKRIKNFANAAVDSDQFTFKDGKEIHSESTTSDLDEYDDDDDDDEKYYESMLEIARERVDNPTFDVEYHDITTSFQTDNASKHYKSSYYYPQDSNETYSNVTRPCVGDSNQTFVWDDTNRTCCDFTDSKLSWGCNETTMIEQCPNTCGNVTSSFTNNNTVPPFEEQSKSPSESPSNAPRPRWNPFWPRIINSVHFYGYGGSLTEPPCSEWVAWRVMDAPMEISYKQWDQMRNILFNQVDESCHRSSAHWMGSVARPTQSLNDRPLWKCTEQDYLSDVEKRAAKAT